MNNKKQINKLKKKELIELLKKHYNLNQIFGIFIIELLINVSKTAEFNKFYKENSEMVDEINTLLKELEIKDTADE